MGSCQSMYLVIIGSHRLSLPTLLVGRQQSHLDGSLLPEEGEDVWNYLTTISTSTIGVYCFHFWWWLISFFNVFPIPFPLLDSFFKSYCTRVWLPYFPKEDIDSLHNSFWQNRKKMIPYCTGFTLSGNNHETNVTKLLLFFYSMYIKIRTQHHMTPYIFLLSCVTRLLPPLFRTLY